VSTYNRGSLVSLSTSISIPNSTTTALGAGQVFTGAWEDGIDYSTLIAACLTDQDGTIAVQQSADGVNADSTLTFNITASVNEVHRIVLTRRYFRVVITNTSAGAQTYLRSQASLGSHALLNSPLNGATQQDADAIITKTIESEISIASGLFSGYSIVNKFGLNSDIDTGTVPTSAYIPLGSKID